MFQLKRILNNDWYQYYKVQNIAETDNFNELNNIDEFDNINKLNNIDELDNVNKLNSFNENDNKVFYKARNFLLYECKNPKTFFDLGCKFIHLIFWKKQKENKYSYSVKFYIKFFSKVENVVFLKSKIADLMKKIQQNTLNLPILKIENYSSFKSFDNFYPNTISFDLSLLINEEIKLFFELIQEFFSEITNEYIKKMLKVGFIRKISEKENLFWENFYLKMKTLKSLKEKVFSNNDELLEKRINLKNSKTEKAKEKEKIKIKVKAKGKGKEEKRKKEIKKFNDFESVKENCCAEYLEKGINFLYEEAKKIDYAYNFQGFFLINFADKLILNKNFNQASLILQDIILNQTFEDKSYLKNKRVLQVAHFHFANICLFVSNELENNNPIKDDWLKLGILSCKKSLDLFGDSAFLIISGMFSQLIDVNHVTAPDGSNLIVDYNGENFENLVFIICNIAKNYFTKEKESFEKIKKFERENIFLKMQIQHLECKLKNFKEESKETGKKIIIKLKK